MGTAEDTRRVRKWLFETAWDVRVAGRSLRKSWAFTLPAVITLAISLGGSTLAAVVVYGVLLAPPDYDRPRELMVLGAVGQEEEDGVRSRSDVLPLSVVQYLSEQSRTMDVAAMVILGTSRLVYDGPFRELDLTAATPNLFTTLGVTPAIGRLTDLTDASLDGTLPAVVSYGYWQESYGGGENIVGSRLQLEGQPLMTIVGVLPPQFATLPWGEPTAVWSSIDAVQVNSFLESRTRAVARIRPGVSQETIRAELDVLATNAVASDAGISQISLEPLQESIVASSRTNVLLLILAVGLLLGIGLLNMITFQASRVYDRQNEMSVRAALGASRSRLIRGTIAECMVLTTASTLLGFVMLPLGLDIVLSTAPSVVARMDNISFNVSIFLWSIGVALGTAILIGMLASLKTSRATYGRLKEQQYGWSTSVDRRRFFAFLVGVETTIAVILFVIAGLLLQNHYRQRQLYSAYDTTDVLTARIDLPPGYEDINFRSSYIRNLLSRLSLLPGLDSVAMSSSRVERGLSVETVETEDRRETFKIFSEISSEYGSTVGVKPITGRWFSSDEVEGRLPVVVVSDALASALWQRDDVIGNQLRRQDTDQWLTVVGVVPGEASGLEWGADVYLPYTFGVMPETHLTIYLYIKSAAPNISRSIIEVVEEAEPRSMTTLSPMSSIVAGRTRTADFIARLSGGMAGAAILLTTMGVFSTLSFLMTRRRYEIAIRLAVGAMRRYLVVQLTWPTILVASIGIGSGLYFSWAFAKVLKSQEFFGTLLFSGFDPADTSVYVAAAVLLLAIVFLAVWFPVWRAASRDPLATLRQG